MLKLIQTKGDVLDKYSYLRLEHGGYPLYVIHGCNAQGVMGSGIAKQVKVKHPEAYTEYRRMYHAFPNGKMLGRYCVAGVGSDFSIINAVTQEFYGTDGKKYTSYDAVSNIFKDIAKDFKGQKVVMAIPKKFASDRGGACWKTVKQLIKSELEDTDIILYIVEHDV